MPDESDYDGSEDECHHGEHKYVGKLNTPEFRAWEARLDRRDAEEMAAEEEAERRARMTKHDIS